MNRAEMIETLVKWRLSMPGSFTEEQWREHYEREEDHRLRFLIEFFQIHYSFREQVQNLLANARPEAQEDPVEGEERPLRHEFAVEMMPQVFHGPMTYMEAVEGWRRLKKSIYPQARVVERVVSDWREVKHVDSGAPPASLHALGPAADVPATAWAGEKPKLRIVDETSPYMISGDRFRELAEEPQSEHEQLEGLVQKSTDRLEELKTGWGQPEGAPQRTLAETVAIKREQIRSKPMEGATWCTCGDDIGPCPAHPPLHPRAPLGEGFGHNEAGEPVWRGPEVIKPDDPGCTVCGRDNRNGTHSALERTGHLNHSFQPAVERPQEDATSHDVMAQDEVEARLLQNLKDAASGADRYRPAPEPYEPDETYTKCPGMPEHYREAHRPGGAWWGVTFDHAHNDDGEEYRAYVLEKEKLKTVEVELSTWRCELHPDWLAVNREGVVAHIFFAHKGKDVTTEPDNVVREKKS